MQPEWERPRENAGTGQGSNSAQRLYLGSQFNDEDASGQTNQTAEAGVADCDNEIWAEKIEKALRTPGFWASSEEKSMASSIKVYSKQPPSLTANNVQQCGQMAAFVKESSSMAKRPQAVLAIYNLSGASIIHISSTEGNDAYIELPTELDPVELAQKLLSKLHKGLEVAIGDRDPLTIFDGACRALNFKEIFPDRKVLRSEAGVADGLAARVSSLVNGKPLTIDDTAIVNGFPGSMQETGRVFNGNTSDWTAWADETARWNTIIAGEQFPNIQGSSEEVLNALSSKKNVIVLIAHADSSRIWLPAPPPNGSVLQPSDLDQIEDRIRKNAPVVYLYCCEAAKTEALQSWATELIRRGAAGVYASQSKLPVTNGRKLFDAFLREAKSNGPLDAIIKAERQSGCRELEMWVG